MLRLLVAFATYDGHTAKIADRMALTLEHTGRVVELCDLARSHPERTLEDYDGVIAGGPLNVGKHPSQLVKFTSENLATLNTTPSAFFSVSLSAAGNDSQKGDATRCLNEFLEETGWKPSRSTIVAGALLYRKYGFIKRWMMKMIVKCGGTGDTDTSRNYVYTDWDAVDDFANDFANLVESRAPARTQTDDALIT